MPPFRTDFGPVFTGYQGRVVDRVLDRKESPDLRGVLCGEGGVRRAPGAVKITSYTNRTGYSAGFTAASSTWVKVAGFPLLGSRWTIMGAFQVDSVSGDHYIFDRVVEISSTDYHAPGLRINSSSQLVLEWTDSAGNDKSITSSNTVSTSTPYFFIARRFDDEVALYVGTLTSAPTLWASGTGLGNTDYPTDDATHAFVVGANGDTATPASDFFDGDIDGISVLELSVEDFDMAYVEWPQPRMKRCLLNLSFDEAAGSEFTDLSAHAGEYTITHDADVQHQQTALMATPDVVNYIGEVVKPDAGQRILTIVDGSFYASRAYV
jgi:hypothetical protein